MIISEKQILFFYEVLTNSLCIIGSGSPLKFDRDTRLRIANEIHNQQSDELKEIKE